MGLQSRRVRSCHAKGVGQECISSRCLPTQGQPCGLTHLPRNQRRPKASILPYYKVKAGLQTLPREATRDKFIQKPLTDYRRGAVPGNREGGSFTFCLGFSLGCGRGIHFEGGVRNTKCIVVPLDTSRF